jgi:GH15 family glucan-1,4-alpha-glucosidase
VYALRRVGLTNEAWGFLGWVLDAVECSDGARVLYDLDGRRPPPEQVDPELEGYRRSSPVRWGNAADAQTQHDAYGEILDCAYQWTAGGGAIDDDLWARLVPLIEHAAEAWRTPDHGIWEVRAPGRVFTYSAAMCEVALERGARLVERCGLPGPASRWRREASAIRDAIVEDAWDPSRGSLTEHLGAPGGLDASLLALPLRRVIDAQHPRMVATTVAIVRELGAGDGLLYRYLPEVSPDGVAGHEGAFVMCSFWLVDNLALQGRLDEAVELFDSLCERSGTLGLLPEQIDPGSGRFLGNHPQAFSHVGLISSGVNLARCIAGRPW